MVWGKAAGYHWWPGIILDASDFDSTVIPEPNKIPVRFYNDDNRWDYLLLSNVHDYALMRTKHGQIMTSKYENDRQAAISLADHELETRSLLTADGTRDLFS